MHRREVFPDSLWGVMGWNLAARAASFSKRLWKFVWQPRPSVGPARPVGERPVVHIDVTRIAHSDVGTGVQRVVRQVSRHWYSRPDRAVTLNFVQVDETGSIVQALQWAEKVIPSFRPEVDSSNPMLRAGDIYFCLDLAVPPRGLSRGSIQSLKASGIHVVFVVYDILSITHPQFFRPSSRLLFRWWLKSVERCDAIITISRDAKSSIVGYLQKSWRPVSPIPVSVIPLSGEAEQPPNHHLPHRGSEVVPEKSEGTLFVAVGTIEPRKGYENILDGFDVLWRDGNNSQLWIFGKPGWKTQKLQARILSHTEFGRKLKWFRGATDTQVRQALGIADALIMNSFAEGLGLPILEAHSANLPVIARDINVFREVAPAGTTWLPAVQHADTLARIFREFSPPALCPLPTTGSSPMTSWETVTIAIEQHFRNHF